MYDNLNKEDVKIVSSSQSRINSTIEILESDLKYLSETLNMYKDYLNKNIDASLTEANIVSKYTNSQVGGSYNLPGVFSGTVANYNLNDMKSDNNNLRIAQEIRSSTEKQRNSTYSAITQTYTEIRNRLNLLAQDNVQVFTYLEGMKDNGYKS